MKKIVTLLIVIMTAAGLGLAAAAPAQAGTQPAGVINYTANCPGTASSQQLVITNYEHYSSQSVDATSIFAPWHQLYVANNTYPDQTWTHRDGRTSWLTWQSGDVVSYEITYQRPDSGAFLNWYYHVDCFY